VRRREFITLLSGAAAAWPLAARAQQAEKVYRIAIASPSAPIAEMSEAGDNPAYHALFKELHRLGYVEGQNLVVERYSAEGRPERYAELAHEVTRANPDVVVAVGPLVRSLKALTDKIPIVGRTDFAASPGLVTSLARPGANITGASAIAGPEIWPKRLQILLELVPKASRVGFLATRFLWDTGSPSPQGTVMREAARQAGVSLLGPPLDSPTQQAEYRRVFAAMAQEQAKALIVADESSNASHRRLIVGLAETARLPTIFPDRMYFDVGGLMVYGSSVAEEFGRLADYVDKILKGTKPGDLPIYMASKFELLLNLKAAKALGIEFPTSLLVRADDVIEQAQ
jgi:putative ABC transport system substrate-binding protein